MFVLNISPTAIKGHMDTGPCFKVSQSHPTDWIGPGKKASGLSTTPLGSYSLALNVFNP